MKYLIISTSIITLIIVVAFYQAILTMLYYAGAFIAAVGIIALGCGVMMAREKWLTMRAERKRREIGLELDGHGMLHLINYVTNHTQNLTINTNAYRNGHYETPSRYEINAFNTVMSKGKQTAELPLLPPTTSSSSDEIDLLQVMTQPAQSYAFIGGQQQGKTYQARQVAAYWQARSVKPVMIGPKLDRGEWEGCTIFGGQYNFGDVKRGIRNIRALAEHRHADITHTHKQHPILPVFFDDWTKTRQEMKDEAEGLIVDASTLYASVNIILYFIIHLDTAAAWGVDKLGAALKENYIKLRIVPFYQQGIIVKELSTGLLTFPGDKVNRPVKLLGSRAVTQPYQLPENITIIEPDEDVAEVEKEEADAHFVRLVREGESRGQASLRAYGRRYAGDLVTRGKKALGENPTT